MGLRAILTRYLWKVSINTLLATSMQKQHLLAVSFPKINKLLNLGSWFAVILFLNDTLQFNNSSITFSSRFDESGGDFFIFQKFFKIFSKPPPKNPFPFQTSEGTFNFLFKIPPFFRFPVQTSEGINFLKEIFEKSVNLGVHFGTLCPNE